MEVEGIKVENEESRKFQCKLCLFQGTKYSNLNAHVKAVHAKIKEYECQACGGQVGESDTMRG